MEDRILDRDSEELDDEVLDRVSGGAESPTAPIGTEYSKNNNNLFGIVKDLIMDSVAPGILNPTQPHAPGWYLESGEWVLYDQNGNKCEVPGNDHP